MTSGNAAGIALRRKELQTLLDDVELLSNTDFPYLVTMLPALRFVAWQGRRENEIYRLGPDAESELLLPRVIRDRLETPGSTATNLLPTQVRKCFLGRSSK